MSKRKINRSIFERCLLTEVSPYETPLIYSNWGSYNYYRNLKPKAVPSDLKKILEHGKPTVPLNYSYFKDSIKKRTLSLIHPGASKNIIELYEKYELLILRLTQKSLYSIRYPHSVARYFTTTESRGKVFNIKSIEQLDENQPFASSYFAYMHYSHLHKYFESDAFTEIEKNFRFLKHLDVSKCFPSIYTHSISWATRGKLAAKKRKNVVRKDRAFDSVFDNLMQLVNYQETNGIIIGPELSRIFSEIIFQEIDKKIEAQMRNKGYKHGADYHCSRYIDDYYLYYNTQGISEQFSNVLADELEFFKMYLNHDKIENKTRPFISDISIKKLAISNYINELTKDIQTGGNPKINSQKEINKIRNILNSKPQENHAITNFFLSALLNRIYVIKGLDKKHAIKIIKLFVDIVFYWIRIDTRVSSIYKLTKIILTIANITKKYPKHERISIFDKMYYEICETIKAATKNNASVELMNLLIAESELGKTYLIEKELIGEIIEECRKSNQLDEKKVTRLNYFEITTLLYYVKNHSEYDDQKLQVILDSKCLLKHYSVLEYSESAHLLLDLVSSPYLEKHHKYELVAIAFETCGSSNSKKDQEINRFINFVQKESWYTNWKASIDLKRILKKKEYMLSY